MKNENDIILWIIDGHVSWCVAGSAERWVSFVVGFGYYIIITVFDFIFFLNIKCTIK